MLESQFPKLVPLFLAAGQRDQALALFENKRWLRLRVEEFGFDHLIEDARLVLAASVKCGRDDDVVRLLLRVDHAAQTLRPSWDDGSAAIAIVAADSPKRVRGLLRSLGSSGTPWAAFLAILRLLDLHAVTAANELLRQTAEEHWPGYCSSERADGLSSWADFDAGPIVYFLMRVMAASPELATRIVFRLYGNQRPTVVPSICSIWAALLEQLVITDAPVAHVIAAIEQVHESILPHSTGLADVLVRLCEARQRAIEAVTDRTNMSWLLREIQISVHIFGYAAKAVGDNENRKRALLASLLIHFVHISERTRSQELQNAIDKTMMMIKEKCSIPPVPNRHEYGDRSEILARYAFALDAIRHPGSLQAAEAALVAADLDAHSNDPPLGHVAKALDWLEKLKLGSTAERAIRLRRELKLSSTALKETVWRPSADVRDPFQYGLALLEGQPPRAGASTLKRGSRKRLSEEDSPAETAADRIRRALIEAWAGTATGQAVEEVRRLDAARSEGSRAEFNIDLGALRINVAKHAAQLGDIREARALLEISAVEALQADDLNTAASAIADLALFDPEKAEQLLISGQVRNQKAAGVLAAGVVIKLTGVEDYSLADRFASHLAARHGRLKNYELWLISSCSRHPQLARHIERLVDLCICQLEADVTKIIRENPGDWPSKFRENEEVSSKVMACVASLGACSTLKPEVEERFALVLGELINQLRADGYQSSVGHDFLMELIERQVDVRQRGAAKFYINFAGTPAADFILPATLLGLDVFLNLASALFEGNPKEAQDIASQAFGVARKAVSSMPMSGDTVQRGGALLLETLAGSFSSKRSLAVRSAEDFVAAAKMWASKGGASKVAQSLDEIADAASDMTAKAVLRAGAASLHLRAGELESAERSLLSLPSSTLRSLDVLIDLPDDVDKVAWSRRILAERIVDLLPGPDFDVAWLHKLFVLGTPICESGAISRLHAIEAALLMEE
jgi:hypothetical protein